MPILTPDDAQLAELASQLARWAAETDLDASWPQRQLEACGQFGVFRWFIPEAWGGYPWDEHDVLRGYLALSEACLTTTFILTQRTGACRRIATSQNDFAQQELLPPLARGELFATVGISHLTTSRRHLARPALRAHEVEHGFVLEGFSPWVTGADHADYLVVGADIVKHGEPDGSQILIVVPTDTPGVAASEHARLLGLTASHTGPVEFEEAFVPRQWLLAGPCENVMAGGSGGNTGGLQTSTLALGLANAAIGLLRDEAQQRDRLASPELNLRHELDQLQHALFAAVRGQAVCTSEQLRQRANSLALRSAQAALVAAKGAGYVQGHPAGRWCREALFFLVWSCPQPVVDANLCELAGIAH